MSESRWGIVSGLAPLASAEFLKTVYEESPRETEQSAPSVVFLSDPSFPDRTECVREGRTEELTARLNTSVRLLLQLGVTNIAICCVTLHAVLDSVPSPARCKIVSLGARIARVFDKHPHWHPIAARVAMPGEREMAMMHSMIYDLKRNRMCDRHIELIAGLMNKYEIESFLAGCTELHILQRRMRVTGTRLRSIDPLQILAERIADFQVAARAEATHE